MKNTVRLHGSCCVAKKQFYKDLISLPGIGEYTASAILSFAYGKYAIALDTNVKRFIIRIFGLQNENKVSLSL